MMDHIYFITKRYYFTNMLANPDRIHYIWSTKKLNINDMKTKKEELAEEPFIIRPYLKSELAHKYNPHLQMIYAMQKFRTWIRNNKELYAALYNGSEGKNDHAYSIRQVRLIVKYLDEP